MGARRPPTPPNPHGTVRRQQGYNREAMTDAARFSNVNQSNPWGARTFSGTPGTDDYKLTTTLNPADQGRLDSTRHIQNALLSIITGQGGGRAGKPGQPQGKPGQPQAMPPMQMGQGQPPTQGGGGAGKTGRPQAASDAGQGQPPTQGGGGAGKTGRPQAMPQMQQMGQGQPPTQGGPAQTMQQRMRR